MSNDDEITIGTNPYVFEDNDTDGIADHFDPDDDNDGILDSVECGYPGGGLINGGFELGTNGCNSIANQSEISFNQTQELLNQDSILEKTQQAFSFEKTSSIKEPPIQQDNFKNFKLYLFKSSRIF